MTINGGNLPIKKLYPGPLLFMMIYIAVLVVLQSLNVWDNYFFVPHRFYLIYNILRTIFFVFLAWLMYYTGIRFHRLCLKGDENNHLDLLDVFLLSSFTGSSFWIIVVFFLGLMNLYYPIVILVITTPFIYLSYQDFIKYFQQYKKFFYPENLWLSIKKKPLVSLSIILVSAYILTIYLTTVLYPYNTQCNDEFGNYLPYFSQVIQEQHGLWPTSYFNHFFATKTAGLQFLAMTLTDTHSCKLVNFYFVLLGALLIYQIIKKMSRNSIWPLLALGIYFNIFLGMVLVKSHAAISICILFMTYLCGVIFSASKEQLSTLFFATICICVGISLFLSITSLCFIYIVFFSAVIAFTAGDRYRTCYLLSMVVISVLSLSSIFLINYLYTGIVDLFIRFADSYFNLERLAQWVSPVAVNIQIAFNSNDCSFLPLSEILSTTNLFSSVVSLFSLPGLSLSILPTPLKIPENFYPWLILLLILSCLYPIIVLKKDFVGGRKNYLILSLGHLLAGLVLHMSFRHGALARGTIYLYFFSIIVCFFWISSLLDPQHYKRPFVQMGVSILSVLITIVVLFINSTYLKNYITERTDLLSVLRFLYGRISYGEVYDNQWGLKDFWDIQTKMPSGERIISLQFTVGAFGMPHSQFERVLQNHFNDVLDDVYYGSPEQARQALLRKGIRYAYINPEAKVNWGHNNAVFFSVLAPIFSPDNLPKYWRLVCPDKYKINGYLLTLKQEGTCPVTERFLKEYRTLLATSSIHAKEAYLEVGKRYHLEPGVAPPVN